MNASNCAFAAVIVGAALAAGACHRRDTGELVSASVRSPVLAEVGDVTITVDDFQARLDAMSPFVRARYSSPERKKGLLDDMVRFELLASEARRRGYDRDPAVLHAVKEALVTKLLEHGVESKLDGNAVSDADAERYYSSHPDEFHRKEAVRVSEIVVKDRATADRVAALASPHPGVAGADQKAFRDLALQYSEDADSRSRSGDLGFLERGTDAFPKALVDAAFALADVGAVSPPVDTGAGWAVVMLTQRRPGFDRPLADALDEIRQRLLRDARPRAIDAFVGALEKTTPVTIHDENLRDVAVSAIRPVALK